VTDSIKAFVSVYDMLYSHYPDYIPVNPDTINTWDFSECKLLHKYKDHSVEEIFGMKEFFDRLELFPNAYEVLKEISKRYELWMVSIGTDDNLFHKIQYVKHRLPFIKNKVYINNSEVKMDKCILSPPFAPSDSIFMDDVYSNLVSANVYHKYCYGKVYSYNQEWTGKRLYNYIDVANEFLR
jgi:hypothetical protein